MVEPASVDLEPQLREAVEQAFRESTPLRVRGGGSKDFYGRAPHGEPIEVGGHRGIIEYDPAELVIAARSGTPLAEIEELLARHGQMLPFEPPHFGPGATLGGAVASGLSGPRRPYAGAVRDYVLGVRCINGRGESLSFGGRVMKNVAGYDVSRLMCGALGTLGVLLEVCLKVLPAPERELTLCQEQAGEEAIIALNRWAARPIPISGGSFHAGVLRVRLSGSAQAVEAARKTVGGEEDAEGGRYWLELREQRNPFFTPAQALWRVSLPSATRLAALPGQQLIDWGGAQRWLGAEQGDANELRQRAERLGGHAALFRGGDRSAEVFHPLPAALHELHRRLKQAFDPRGILNPGRMYAAL